MPHPLVLQLRFARSEFLRGIDSVTDEDACRRVMPMNCISWNVGHLAWQEQRYWLTRGQGRTLRLDVQEQFASGGPGSTPLLSTTLAAWREIVAEADPWLDQLTVVDLEEEQEFAPGFDILVTNGSLLLRMIYHYWYHTGENAAIRQMLGHRDLPDFVGDIDGEAPYIAEG